MFRLNVNSNFKGRKDINILTPQGMIKPFLFCKIASMKSSLYILIISLLIVSCNSQEDYIPEVYVDILVNLSSPQYSDLQVSGNSIFIPGGVEGIIIYHGVGDYYRVYDRNCSYEPSLTCSVIDSVSSGLAYCGCCPSMFSLEEDGAARNSPALLPLKAYYFTLSENNQMRISN
jgi:hypothetical protein